MVECPAEENFFAADVLEPNQWIVRSHLRIITVAVRLRRAVQLPAAKPIRMSTAQCFGHVGDRYTVTSGDRMGSNPIIGTSIKTVNG